MLKATINALGTASDRLAVLSGWSIILFALLVSVEVLLRKFGGISIQGLDEYGGYVFGITAAFGFSYALFTKAHIRVDVLLRLVPQSLRSLLHILAIVTLAFFACMIFYSGTGLVASSWSLSARAVSPLQTPLIFPQGLWLAGLGLFAASSVLLTVQALIAATKRNWSDVEAAVGVPSVEDEAREEVEAAKARGVTATIVAEKGGR